MACFYWSNALMDSHDLPMPTNINNFGLTCFSVSIDLVWEWNILIYQVGNLKK